MNNHSHGQEISTGRDSGLVDIFLTFVTGSILDTDSDKNIYPSQKLNQTFQLVIIRFYCLNGLDVR